MKDSMRVFWSTLFYAKYVREIQAHKYQLPHVSHRSLLEDLDIEIDREKDLELEVDLKIEKHIEIVHTKVR